MSINNDHEPLQPSGFTAAEEISGLEKQHHTLQIAVGERKVVDIPVDLPADPDMLLGYLRNVRINPEAGTGTVDIIEGASKNHGTVHKAELREQGRPIPGSYDETILYGEDKFVGQVRFFIDSYSANGAVPNVQFELLIDQPIDDSLRTLWCSCLTFGLLVTPSSSIPFLLTHE